jgi:hypothetical protein
MVWKSLPLSPSCEIAVTALLGKMSAQRLQAVLSLDVILCDESEPVHDALEQGLCLPVTLPIVFRPDKVRCMKIAGDLIIRRLCYFA